MIAALSNNSVPLSAKGGPQKPAPTRPSLALGESDITLNPTLQAPRATFAAPAVDLDTLTSALRYQKTSAEFLYQRTATDEYADELGATSNHYGKLVDTFFVSKQGGGPILEDWLRYAMDYISGSPRMEQLLSGTDFIQDPSGILKAIVLNEWANPGYLSAATSSYKADVCKFLKPGESAEKASDILSGTCRLVQVLPRIKYV